MEEEYQDINHHEEQVNITKVTGMYQDWFLDYASYVILERAVPDISDGFKPVQRRIMHSLKELDDQRYNKVANVVGNTMKYHPHGDTSISDAIVQLGQKDLLIDTQGNWGNIFTGDRAAAARYIEARLSKFALEVVFNPKTTIWQASYDGRNKEPIHLPVKFPLILAQGVEGIAVGLSTKIMPHNFIELIDASIKNIKGIKPKIYPDFPTGGMADFTNYSDGLRGGKIKLRARVCQRDKKTLKIYELPFGTTTSTLIDSIIKANDKGKIKIKKIEDNTAENVEILIHLANDVSPDKTIDALYAFTDCQVSISPLACVIQDEKPLFLGVSEILYRSTENTKYLLKRELEIKLNELQEQWHFLSLERIFIEQRIYRNIEDEETWEGVISTIDKGLKPYIKHLIRKVTQDDIIKLTEIKIKRISKFDLDKAQQVIENIEEQIKQVKYHLENLIDFAINYFKNLKQKYKQSRDRKTEIRVFDDINAHKVAVSNTKLYVNREEGFIGTQIKKDEFAFECSDIDDIIVFKKDGTMLVTKVTSKMFVGKHIIYLSVFEKGDERMVYNMIYRDGKTKISYKKRFNVTAITRDKEYRLTQANKGSEVLYFSANPNGEAEKVTVHLTRGKTIKILKFDIDFSDLEIKSKGVKGNMVTPYPIKRIEFKKKGISTLPPRDIWFDNTIQRLNTDGVGKLLGKFLPNEKILTIYQSGTYKIIEVDLNAHFDDDMIVIEKWNPNKPISVIYYEGLKQRFYIKRFLVKSAKGKEKMITDHKDSFLEWVSTDDLPRVEVVYAKERNKPQRENTIINVKEFIAVRGIKAMGNQLTAYKVKQVNALEPFRSVTTKKNPPLLPL